MRLLFILFLLFLHLLVTLARLARPGGIRAVAAESLAVKHQLLIMKRSRRRGHQQVSNQPEPQPHAAPEFNALSAIRKPARRHRFVSESAIRHTQVQPFGFTLTDPSERLSRTRLLPRFAKVSKQSPFHQC
jgi:hypothetical protein